MKNSIRFTILILNLSLMPVCMSQNLLAYPESIIYDSLHYRYLISNWPTGDIIQVDSSGNQSYFVQGVMAFNGLEIVGNVVYVGCDSMIRGFDLESGSMVMDVHVTGFSSLNDLTADTMGNLYAGDLFGTSIIKVNISTQNWWVFVNGNGINRPNGIFYDKSCNRILVCSYRNHPPIQAISLSDSLVTTITTTNLTNCDGITKDRYGRYYITSGGEDIYRFDNAFSNPPVVVYSNSCCPADISYNPAHNVLAIPLQLCSSWDSVAIETPVGIVDSPTDISSGLVENTQCYPNPAKDYTRIDFVLKRKGKVNLTLCDISGKEFLLLLNEEKNPGTYSIKADLQSVNSGIYLISLKANTQVISKELTILK